MRASTPGQTSTPILQAGALLADGCCRMRHAGLTCSGATRSRLLQHELCSEAASERAALADLVAEGPVSKQELDSGCAWAAEGCLRHFHGPVSTAAATCRDASSSHPRKGPVSVHVTPSLQEALSHTGHGSHLCWASSSAPCKIMSMCSLTQHS